MSGDAAPPGRVLVVGAHPDDCEVFAGATAGRWASQGAHVEFLVLTDGRLGSPDPERDPAELAAVRVEEARDAAALLAVAWVRFGGFPDGGLARHLEDATELVARTIREARPDVLMVHDPWREWQLHPDHRAAGTATCDGMIAAREHHGLARPAPPAHRPRELWLMDTGAPDHIEDVAEDLERKLDAIALHASQFAHVQGWREDMAEWAERIGGDRGYRAGEAFRRISLAD